MPLTGMFASAVWHVSAPPPRGIEQIVVCCPSLDANQNADVEVAAATTPTGAPVAAIVGALAPGAIEYTFSSLATQ